MPILQIYVDEVTMRRLRALSHRHDRTIEDLAEAAVSEAVLDPVRRGEINSAGQQT